MSQLYNSLGIQLNQRKPTKSPTLQMKEHNRLKNSLQIHTLTTVFKKIYGENQLWSLHKTLSLLMEPQTCIAVNCLP